MAEHTKKTQSRRKIPVLYHVNQQRVVTLYDGLTFGRAEGNEIFPNDPLVSRTHCKVHISGNQVLIEDLGSSNKTLVNGKEILPKIQVPLSIGDRIVMGNQHFLLQSSGQSLGFDLEMKAMANVGLQTQGGTPRGWIEALKTFRHPRSLDRASIGVLLMGLGFAVLSDDPNEFHCKWFPKPFQFPEFIQWWAFIKGFAVTFLFAWVCQKVVMEGRHNRTSARALGVVLGLAGIFFSSVVMMGDPEINRRALTNRFVCSCMAPDVLAQGNRLEHCMKWAQGGKSKDLVSFPELPAPSRNAFLSRLSLSLQQRHPSSYPNFPPLRAPSSGER